MDAPQGSLFAIAHPSGKLMYSTTIKATIAASPRRAASSKNGKTGFICPLCHESLKHANELLAHQKQCERNRMWRQSKRLAALFSSIDLVQNAKPIHHNLFMGQIDTIDQSDVYAFVTAGHYQLLLAHAKRARDEDSVKNFFAQVHSHLVKILLNPFQQLDAKIESRLFDKQIQKIGERYLRVM